MIFFFFHILCNLYHFKVNIQYDNVNIKKYDKLFMFKNLIQEKYIMIVKIYKY